MKEGLSVAGAFSMLETEITDALVPTNDVTVGSDLAFAPGLQGNVRVRQEWGMSAGNVGHMQVQFTYSDDSYSDVMNPNKALQDGYSYVDMRFGVSNDELTAELYIDNVTDERAEISNTFVFDRQRVAYIRPTTIGIRVKKNF
jgi:outer membrane receptor protein involved in Fe transport